jgi:hypothetical protein
MISRLQAGRPYNRATVAQDLEAQAAITIDLLLYRLDTPSRPAQSAITRKT